MDYNNGTQIADYSGNWQFSWKKIDSLMTHKNYGDTFSMSVRVTCIIVAYDVLFLLIDERQW